MLPATNKNDSLKPKPPKISKRRPRRFWKKLPH
jgi:hypothetical protein